MQEEEKAREIEKKRQLAAKGLKERADGRPVDPLEVAGSLDADDGRLSPEDSEEREKDIAERALPAAAALRRSG